MVVLLGGGGVIQATLPPLPALLVRNDKTECQLKTVAIEAFRLTLG